MSRLQNTVSIKVTLLFKVKYIPIFLYVSKVSPQKGDQQAVTLNNIKIT